MRFTADPTMLAGLMRIERRRIEDERGFFSRVFCAEQLADAGFDLPVAQINHTLTRRRGAVRGLHFQFPPHSETKLVSCLRGEVFDVAVDLRRDSPTFLQWHGEILSHENQRRSSVRPSQAVESERMRSASSWWWRGMAARCAAPTRICLRWRS